MRSGSAAGDARTHRILKFYPSMEIGKRSGNCSSMISAITVDDYQPAVFINSTMNSPNGKTSPAT